MEKTKTTIADLNRIYSEAEECDKHIFIEERSNVLLASGDHYTKKNSQFWSRLRDNKDLNEETKLRITKNHIHRITGIYSNNIYALSPGVAILPQNEKELHDQKVAEMHSKIWQFVKDNQKIKEKTRDLCSDFVVVGEVAWKIFFDPNTGKHIGFAQEMGEDDQPVVDEMGQPVASDQPVFDGDIVIEPIFAANLLRESGCKEIGDSCTIYRKMASVADLKIVYAADESKLKFISESATDVFKVFDSASGKYNDTRGQCMIREFYYPVCPQYANGYYYIATSEGILEEGELPGGFFPIVFTGFDSIPTTPRKRSIIKQLRPVQAEINRMGSQQATTQVTVGDDKLLYQSGASLTQSAKLPGVRGFAYTGAAPTYLPGRSGDQFVAGIQAAQQELYDIANLSEEMADQPSGNVDAFAELFKTMRHKKKYVIYAEKIEQFLIRACELSLNLARHHYSDQKLIDILGEVERMNLPEFRRQERLGYQIRLEPQNDDVETKMGKQIALTNTIQYVGSQLQKEDLGRILRAMPFVNSNDIFSDLTLDYDNVVSDILLMDRGGVPQPRMGENHDYIIKKLTSRMKQSDFSHLDPQIQQIYQQQIQTHEQMQVQQLQQIKQAQAEFIPTGGYLVTVDMYITDPQNPGKTRRARVPYEAMSWLIKQLESQGTVLSEMERLQQGAMSDIASQFVRSGQLPMPPQRNDQPMNNAQGNEGITNVV